VIILCCKRLSKEFALVEAKAGEISIYSATLARVCFRFYLHGNCIPSIHSPAGEGEVGEASESTGVGYIFACFQPLDWHVEQALVPLSALAKQTKPGARQTGLK
jgi:hypothetical protein